jgi:hypothetical protein
MKVVMEFEYPQDKHRVECALKAEEWYEIIADIKAQVNREFTHKADLLTVLGRVKELTEEAMKEMT